MLFRMNISLSTITFLFGVSFGFPIPPPPRSNCDIYSVLGNQGIEVYTENDAGYEEARQQYGDLVIDFAYLINPTMIVYATNIEEVQLTISFVNNCDDIDIIVPRSGGHQYSSTSSCNDRCLQLDLKGMNEFTVLDENYIDPDDTTGYTAALVKVAPGLSLNELYPQAAALGLVVLGGVCGDVHVGGNWQSSGHGYYTHSLGSAMDYIIAIDIVLSDGTLITVSKENNYANLFWSLRGGSPGAFGVIVGYTFKAYYGENFPHTHISTTFYRFGNNNEDADVLTKLSELYTKAIESPAFENSLDIGGMYLVIGPKETTSTDIQTLLDYYDANHVVTLMVSYIGMDSNTSFYESDVYSDIIEGIFRNTSLLIQEPLVIYDEKIPASALPLAGLVSSDLESIPGGYTNVISSESFNNNINSLIGNTLTYYVNTLNYSLVLSLQGGIYGGKFVSNDINNIYTSHPYRDTIASLDMTLTLNNNKSINHPDIQVIQPLIDNLTASITNELPLNDQGRIWLPYSHDDIDIENSWSRYYNNDIKFYNKLRCTKYFVDPNDLFKSPLTVTPIDTPLKCNILHNNIINNNINNDDNNNIDVNMDKKLKRKIGKKLNDDSYQLPIYEEPTQQPTEEPN